MLPIAGCARIGFSVRPASPIPPTRKKSRRELPADCRAGLIKLSMLDAPFGNNFTPDSIVAEVVGHARDCTGTVVEISM